jgi:hypothetical protein
MKLSKLLQHLENTPTVLAEDVDVRIQIYDPVSGEPVYCDDFGVSASFGPGYNHIIFIPRKSFVGDKKTKH